MSIGIGQILVIVLVVIILFGRFPMLSKNITDGLDNIRLYLEQKKEITSNSNSNEEDPSSKKKNNN